MTQSFSSSSSSSSSFPSSFLSHGLLTVHFPWDAAAATTSRTDGNNKQQVTSRSTKGCLCCQRHLRLSASFTKKACKPKAVQRIPSASHYQRVRVKLAIYEGKETTLSRSYDRIPTKPNIRSFNSSQGHSAGGAG